VHTSIAALIDQLVHCVLYVKEQKSEKDVEHREREETWHAQQLHDGAHASHLRSHNVAPVPRVYGSSALDHTDTQKQPQTADVNSLHCLSLYAFSFIHIHCHTFTPHSVLHLLSFLISSSSLSAYHNQVIHVQQLPWQGVSN